MSSANLAVVTMQDLIGLGSSARMNIPSTLGVTGRGEHFRDRSMLRSQINYIIRRSYMDVLEDKEDKYNVLFYCKSDLPYGESS